MKQIILFAALLIGTTGLKAQSLKVINNTCETLYWSVVASDAGKCNSVYSTSFFNLSAHSSVTYPTYASIPSWLAGPPTGPIDWTSANGGTSLSSCCTGCVTAVGQPCALPTTSNPYTFCCGSSPHTLTWSVDPSGNATVTAN